MVETLLTAAFFAGLILWVRGIWKAIREDDKFESNSDT
jgi:hypothetical protein